MVDSIVSRIDRLHLTTHQVIRFAGVACSFACLAISLGTVVILRDTSRVLNLAYAYPFLFAAAAVAWLTVAFYPEPGRCAWAASLAAVPASFRSVDFAVTWVTEGTENPGTRIVAIGGWALVAVLCVTLAVVLPLVAQRSDRRNVHDRRRTDRE